MNTMARIYHIGSKEYTHKEYDEAMIEEAFKEGCEHGYQKAMKELEEKDAPAVSEHSFEEKMKRLKEKYM